MVLSYHYGLFFIHGNPNGDGYLCLRRPINKNPAMKTVLSAIFLSLISLPAISQPPPTKSSMEVLEDNRVKFSLFAPEASAIGVTGEWMPGYGAVTIENGVMKRGPIVSEQLVKDDTGSWTITLGPLKPNSYGYAYIIDGVMVTDPSMKYETYVSKELIAAIDAKYPTIADNKGRAITGLSMGGHGAFYLAFRHQDVWGIGNP